MFKESAMEVSQEQKPSITKHQTQHDNERLFWDVVHKCIHLSSNPKQTAVAAEFVKNVEAASRFALQGTGLFPEWQRLVADDVWQGPRLMQQIFGRCARAYRERGLAPDRYLRKRKKKSVRKCDPLALQGHKWLCKLHGQQTVMVRTKGADGESMRFGCGCQCSEDFQTAVPVSGTVVSIAAWPAAESLPFGDEPMCGWIGPSVVEPFVNADAVAEFLSMSRREVLKLTREGRITGHVISGKQRKTYKYRLSEVERDITGIIPASSPFDSSAKAA